MQTDYCKWLNELADLGEKEGIVIEARFQDLLYQLFLTKPLMSDALIIYRQAKERIKAIGESEQFSDFFKQTFELSNENEAGSEFYHMTAIINSLRLKFPDSKFRISQQQVFKYLISEKATFYNKLVIHNSGFGALRGVFLKKK